MLLPRESASILRYLPMMSSCIVLADSDVHDLLMSLSRGEIHGLLKQIGETLQQFSTGNIRKYQPEASTINHADGRRNLFRPFTSSTAVGVKIIVDPSAALAAQKEPTNEAERAERNKLIGLHGVIALCDQNGFPLGFINAEEVTGYRTSMSAILLYVRRKRTENIVVFGAGKQALWHVRLALGLRGEDIKRITFFNRSAGRTKDLITRLKRENAERWKAQVKFESALGGEEGLKAALAEADVVFCTTPSKQVLFPAECVKDDCYVSAIGSWSADMIELDPKLLRKAAQSGMVVVDDREACKSSTGELRRSGLADEKIAEVGEVLDTMAKSGVAAESQKQSLEEGLVVYKSIGVSLTDLITGQVVLELAKARNLGLAVPEF